MKLSELLSLLEEETMEPSFVVRIQLHSAEKGKSIPDALYEEIHQAMDDEGFRRERRGHALPHAEYIHYTAKSRRAVIRMIYSALAQANKEANKSGSLAGVEFDRADILVTEAKSVKLISWPPTQAAREI